MHLINLTLFLDIAMSCLNAEHDEQNRNICCNSNLTVRNYEEPWISTLLAMSILSLDLNSQIKR